MKCPAHGSYANCRRFKSRGYFSDRKAGNFAPRTNTLFDYRHKRLRSPDRLYPSMQIIKCELERMKSEETSCITGFIKCQRTFEGGHVI